MKVKFVAQFYAFSHIFLCFLYLVVLMHRINAGSPELVEDDDCKIINERTVFDHIRKKAKNLPVLATSNVDPQCSPSLETLTLIRKRNRERQLELDSAIEVLDDMYEESNSHLNLVSLAEPKKAEQNRQFDKDPIPKCHVNTVCANSAGD